MVFYTFNRCASISTELTNHLVNNTHKLKYNRTLKKIPRGTSRDYCLGNILWNYGCKMCYGHDVVWIYTQFNKKKLRETRYFSSSGVEVAYTQVFNT